MLKSKVNKTEFDALNDILKAEYKEVNGEYFLDSDDAGELRRAKDRETEEAKKQKQRADDLEAKALEDARKATEAALELAKKSGDVAALEASWKAKLDAQIAAHTAEIQKRDSIITRTFVDNVAHQLSEEISTSPLIINPHIKSRLAVEFVDGEPITRVLDKNGKPSAASIDDLRKEFVDNETFSTIIIGSKASGSGTDQTRGGGGAGKKLHELSEEQKVALARSNPAEYKRRVDAGEMKKPVPA